MPESVPGTLRYRGRSVCSAGHAKPRCAVLSPWDTGWMPPLWYPTSPGEEGGEAELPGKCHSLAIQLMLSGVVMSQQGSGEIAIYCLRDTAPAPRIRDPPSSLCAEGYMTRFALPIPWHPNFWSSHTSASDVVFAALINLAHYFAKPLTTTTTKKKDQQTES